MSRRLFLSARWENLLMVTWRVPDALLEPYLPPGVTLDRFEDHIDGGSALVSLVAFDFLDTRVFGVRWPTMTNFPELNLRFYIRSGQRRGVCFIKEYVPSSIIAGVARLVYNEPYYAPWYKKKGQAHLIKVGGRQHRIAWQSSGAWTTPATNTLSHALKEHDLGVGTLRNGNAVGYGVEHPVWRVRQHVELDMDVDFAKLYGNEWAWLGDALPLSTQVAEGSAVKVFKAEALGDAHPRDRKHL